LKSYLL